MLNGLDLLSGIGGISLALKEWVRPIAYCEVDRYCQGVLLSRMQSGDLSCAPIWDDVRTLNKKLLPEIDIVYGGFPCQDISTMGTGSGLDGKRSGLFFEIIRLVRELRPRFIFLENVPAITVRGLDRVLLELTALGYDSRWTIVSAREVGACHQRDRWFLVAHDNGKRLWNGQQSEKYTSSRESKHDGEKWDSTNSTGARLEGFGGQEQKFTRPVPYGGWSSEPTVRGRNNGIPNRVDRIRGLGNAVVPAQAREAFMRLTGV